ncbi:hypothetical protein FA13DRAFT_171467 [Coprinellus micaceus]|uniref:Uncharacterized protein n=1 Tax=Coprinellus micaceus TaxID=71717 RepID=A0A4Y7SIH9_COPMI|nr:hypothetical protein FA13DRAFT_171467 [Coprinellus micaceus]
MFVRRLSKFGARHRCYSGWGQAQLQGTRRIDYVPSIIGIEHSRTLGWVHQSFALGFPRTITIAPSKPTSLSSEDLSDKGGILLFLPPISEGPQTAVWALDSRRLEW